MTKLNPIHECNAREVEMMVGKAMCAYANWKSSLKAMHAAESDIDRTLNRQAAIAGKNEYEATARCIDMFVVESIYEIQHVVSGRAEAELLTA